MDEYVVHIYDKYGKGGILPKQNFCQVRGANPRNGGLTFFTANMPRRRVHIYTRGVGSREISYFFCDYAVPMPTGLPRRPTDCRAADSRNVKNIRRPCRAQKNLTIAAVVVATTTTVLSNIYVPAYTSRQHKC